MNAPSQRGPKFRRRAEARPDEVLDAALDLFMEKGFAATRVEDIGKRAKVSKGTVYLYFSSKEALLEALIKRALVPVADTVTARAHLFEGNPREAIGQAAKFLVHAMQDPKVLAIPKIVMREVVHFPAIAEMYRREVIDRALPVMIGLIRRGVAQGIFREVDPELAARNVIGPLALHVIIAEVFGIVPAGGMSLERFIEHHLDVLFNGLAANPQSGEVRHE